MSQTSRITCLSAEPHNDNIKEHLLHFLGCIEISDRRRFLDEDSHEIWQTEIEHHLKNGKTRVEAEEISRAKRERWKSNCLSELRRIEFIKATLQKDEEERQLISNITISKKNWKHSSEFRYGIEVVREWRESRVSHDDNSTPDEDLPQDVPEGEYKPEKDVNVPIMQFKDGEPLDFELCEADRQPTNKVWGTFPDQKTTMEHLLDKNTGEQNLLYRGSKEKDKIKYFHLPSNNMAWAEEAVARFFNEDRPEFYTIRREIGKVKKTETAMILKESHWRGQLHGGHLSINSRFMRPFCEALSSSITKVDHVPKNIVLFMPYLHWETSRNRERFAQEIDQIVSEYCNKEDNEELEKKVERQRKRQQLHRTPRTTISEALPNTPPSGLLHRSIDILRSCFSSTEPKDASDSETATESERPANRRTPRMTGRILTFRSLIQRIGYPKSPLKVDETGRLRVVYEDEHGQERGSALGQYLIDAARLFEAINNYRDKQLLRRCLMTDPPLHPRRTLDQAYYWTLNTTRSRDRDQVVYRATTAKSADFHAFDYRKCQWINHKGLVKNHVCEDCTQKIKMVSRVVMVDQLWMWILDANTIITCFPKRYGANKHDSSGVHKLVRSRIGEGRHQQVKSVFDLALIIFEECSNTFFDRTRALDKQPQVLDAFSEAIGDIMHKQTKAFDRLWRWTEESRKIYKSRARTTGSSLHIPLLDITPEGELEKEIKDILDELGIMIYIHKTHRDVLKQFIGNVKHILDPEGHYTIKKGDTETSRRRLAASRRSSATNVNALKDEDKKRDEKDTFDWFNINAGDALIRVNDRIEQLEELHRSAQNTASSVKDLLELKQQQAGVLQAWQSVKQSDEAISQGRAIMVFTVVTIVFLPLSFMSSVFGMNNKEFGGDDNIMSLDKQFRYMFGISAAVIFVTLAFSLNVWARSAIWCGYEWTVLWVCVHTGFYQRYLNINLPSHELHRRTVEATDRIRKKQMEIYSEKKGKKAKEKEVSSSQPSQDLNGNSNSVGQSRNVLGGENVFTQISREIGRLNCWKDSADPDLEAARRSRVDGRV